MLALGLAETAWEGYVIYIKKELTLIEVRLNGHSILLQRFRHDLTIISEWIKFTRADICRWEVLQILCVQCSEVALVLGIDSRVFVELVHRFLVNNWDALSIFGIGLEVGLVFFGDVLGVQGQRDNSDNATNTIFLFGVRGDTIGDGKSQTSTSTAADSEEFVRVTAVRLRVLTGLECSGQFMPKLGKQTHVPISAHSSSPSTELVLCVQVPGGNPPTRGYNRHAQQ